MSEKMLYLVGGGFFGAVSAAFMGLFGAAAAMALIWFVAWCVCGAIIEQSKRK